MTINVYIYKDENNLKYEILESFNNVSFFDLKEISIKSFVNNHQDSLFSNNSSKCFLGIDKIDKKLLLKLSNYEGSCNIIWCFKKLAKSTLIYKKLKDLKRIHTVKDITKYKDKTDFIKKICEKYSIPKKYNRHLLKIDSEDKFFIDSEINKLNELIKIGTKDPINNINLINQSDSNLFKFCSYLLEDPKRSYGYIRFIADNNKINTFYIYSMVIKRLRQYMFLSLDYEKEAFNSWKSFGVFLEKDKKLAFKLGLYVIIDIIDFLNKLRLDLQNEYDYNNVYFKLTSLVEYIIDIKGEKYNV